MNIDNQLLLGIVFITAGVAMGLLAYAAFLNRQQEGEEELADQPEAEPQQGESEALEGQLEPEGDRDTVIATAASQKVDLPPASAPEPIAEPEPLLGAEAETVAVGSVPADPDETAADTVIATPSEEPVAMERPTVLVDRDPNSNRLMIRVDDRVYHSMENLRGSDDWPLVTDLFSDLLAWMIKAGQDQTEDEDHEADETLKQSASMVQQINTILEEKLSHRESGPQAVRLMEGVGGSIRVYIGVDSYSIEEVPDEDVKALIRQAVAEWEERQ